MAVDGNELNPGRERIRGLRSGEEGSQEIAMVFMLAISTTKRAMIVYQIVCKGFGVAYNNNGPGYINCGRSKSHTESVACAWLRRRGVSWTSGIRQAYVYHQAGIGVTQRARL